MGFFFVKKKDSSLHLCINYHGLNYITTKNGYCFLVPSFGSMEGIHMDLAKVKIIADWPIPSFCISCNNSWALSSSIIMISETRSF